MPARYMTRKRFLSYASSAVAVSALVALSGCGDSTPATAPARPAPQVSTIVLHPGSVPLISELTGRVTAAVVAEVRPQVDGIIRARLFMEGGDVKAGDALYEIESATYRARHDKAAAALARAEANLPSAEAKLRRYDGLVARQAVSTQEAESARSEVLQIRADVAAARAELDSAAIDLAHTRVTAPVSGRIETSAVTEGALVSAAQTSPLTVIHSLEEVKLDIARSSADLAATRKSAADGFIEQVREPSVELIMEDGTPYPHQGRVEFSEATVERNTGTYTQRATVPNPEGVLMPGMFVRAQVRDGTAESAFLVPQRGVSRNPKGEPIGMFVGKDGKAEERVLDVVRNVGNSWLVYRGLSDGDRLVVEGAQSVKPGQAVSPQDVSLDPVSGQVSAPQAKPEQK